MNFSQPPSKKGGKSRIVRFLSLLLVQYALMPSVIDARSRLPGNNDSDQAPEPISLPYLKVAGSTSLRFRAPPPTPHLTSKPPAGASPPLSPVAPPTPDRLPDQRSVQSADPALVPPEKAPDQTVPAGGKSQSAILPDDTRQATKPEDFLPFFQFPGAGSDVTAGTPARPPAPGQQPPSSATYQQR